ncbi:MAG: hydantoinase B/oxoprolinase family protein [Rhizobiales bacterium]|nr:hydantoinase B/oxoprolinase family protein [Hyphomicrobiales bacterium]
MPSPTSWSRSTGRHAREPDKGVEPMDQVTLDILWNRLISTVNEQAAALIRSSFTSIVREAGDLSAGVFDRRGRMVAQAVTGTPGHINSMATGMIHFLARYPVDTLAPGDVLVTNDPWKTASQLNDITVATPVFYKGRVVAFFASCCHALDIGGRGLSADSRSIHEEGLFIPIMKLAEAGRPNETLFAMLAANVRTPEEVLGDLHSQITGNEVGARQLVSFLEEFGLSDIEELSDRIVERTEAAMRERIRALPDGDYSYALTIDGFEEPIAIKVRIHVAGDRLLVDYAGSSGPSHMGINVCLNYTRAYTTYGVKCAISPDVPNNEGSFRPIEIEAPEGGILNAAYPSAVAGRHLVGHFLPSAVMGALAGSLPETVIAPGADGLWDTHVAGFDPRTGKHFSYTWFSSGGVGAMADRDGLSATAYPSGIAGVPVEVMETIAPLLVHSRELRCDSGGPGTYRGGLGQEMTFEVLTDRSFLFSGLYERTRHAAPGLAGGSPGASGRLSAEVRSADGRHEPLEIAPKLTRTLKPGTVVTVAMPGGGGYGPPAARDQAALDHDIAEGYVSPQAARQSYGRA